MRKVIETMWTTSNRFVAGPDEMDNLDADVQGCETYLVCAADTLMLDRVPSNDFGDYWPRIARDSAEDLASRHYAQILDRVEKMVVAASGQPLVHPMLLRDGKPLGRPGQPSMATQHLSTMAFSSDVAVIKCRSTIPRSPAAPNTAPTTNE